MHLSELSAGAIGRNSGSVKPNPTLCAVGQLPPLPTPLIPSVDIVPKPLPGPGEIVDAVFAVTRVASFRISAKQATASSRT
jgi:hypothetical protein